jgi:hypothetical protein
MRNLFIFILFSLGQPSFAQSILGQPSFAQSINDANLQELLNKNPSLLNNIPQKDISTIDENLVSENQNVANTGDNLQINLSKTTDQKKINEQSILKRYYFALIGKDLNIYGSNEFNQTENDSLLFFNTIGKNYQLAPGDTIQITIT